MWFESNPIKLEVSTNISEPMTLWGYIFTQIYLPSANWVNYLPWFLKNNNMYFNEVDTHKFATLYTTTKGVPIRQVISLDFEWIH
jgi:hypothetical protein